MRSQTASGKQSVLRAVALQLMIAVATLAACEAILRLADLRYLRILRAGTERIYNYDRELGWFPIANSDVRFTGLRTIAVHHNSLGLRDIEHDSSPKQTIAFVGDSFVWGYDAEADERFTELLRARLPAQRILNVGVAAYGTDQELLLTRRLWDRLAPNAVVLMICVDNDRKDNSANMRYDGHYKPYFAAAGDSGEFAGIPVPWSRHFYFSDYWLVRHSWVARVLVSAYVLLRHPPVSVPDPTERLIDMMRMTVESHGAKFLVGLQYRDPQYEAYLRARGIPYASFDGAEHYFGDGDHWTPKGHALVADRLMELLAQNGVK